MPRYFFSAVDGGFDRDDNGTELPNIPEARKAAVRFIGDVFAEYAGFEWNGSDFCVNVTDESGRVVLVVFAMAVDAKAIWRA